MAAVERVERPARWRTRWYLIIPALVFVLLPVALWHLAHQPQAVHLVEGAWVRDRGEYAGVEACRECHGAIVATQLESNHARTVRDLTREKPRAPFGNGQEVVDPLTGARYRAEQEGREARLAVSSGALRAAERLDFEFGAGRHAYGYVARVEAGDELETGEWIDARLNYYPRIGRWDFTSSQDKPQKYLLTQPLGKPQSDVEILRCFACHSTVVRADGVGRHSSDGKGLRVRPEHSILNITCESCHGPRARHVREARAGPPAREQTWSAAGMNQVCGKCHGISNLDSTHPVIARFQPWGLEQSRCFKESAGRLSCSTCHDPHSNARPDAAFYEARCMSCHTKTPAAPKAVACPVRPTSGCVGCHMPRDSKSMRHVTFADHRIRVVDLVNEQRNSGKAHPAKSAAP